MSTLRAKHQPGVPPAGRTWARSFIVIVLLGSGAIARGAEPLTLEQVWVDVRTRNPQLRSAMAIAAADRERVKQAGTWEDPVGGVEIQRETTNRLNSYDAAEFSVSQKIPL